MLPVLTLGNGFISQVKLVSQVGSEWGSGEEVPDTHGPVNVSEGCEGRRPRRGSGDCRPGPEARGGVGARPVLLGVVEMWAAELRGLAVRIP